MSGVPNVEGCLSGFSEMPRVCLIMFLGTQGCSLWDSKPNFCILQGIGPYIKGDGTSFRTEDLAVSTMGNTFTTSVMFCILGFRV